MEPPRGGGEQMQLLNRVLTSASKLFPRQPQALSPNMLISETSGESLCPRSHVCSISGSAVRILTDSVAPGRGEGPRFNVLEALPSLAGLLLRL